MPGGQATAVPDCIAVSIEPIRVQLPGGAIYAPALLQAASKTAARSGLSKKASKALSALVEAGVSVLNSGSATEIALEMMVHDDTLTATLVGTGCKAPTKRLVKELTDLGNKKAREFSTKQTASALAISFEV